MSKEKEKAGKDPFWVVIAGLILSCYMRFLYYSSRKKFTDTHYLTQFFESGQPAILTAWHNRNVLSPFAFLSQRPRSRQMAPIASASKDGGLAAWAMWGLGLPCVRGSSSRGGAGALKKMIRFIKDGKDLAFTPDGPRGPLHHVHEGVLLAAKMTGAPIVPLTFAAKDFKQLRSWDGLIIPRPFTKLHFIYGEPIFIARKADEETLKAHAETLRTRLIALGERAAVFE